MVPKRILSGWSIRGRPFSPEEFKRAYLRKSLKYADYLTEFARQYKIPKLRKLIT